MNNQNANEKSIEETNNNLQTGNGVTQTINTYTNLSNNAVGNETISSVENVAPIKPTLDSILNGNSEVDTLATTPIETIVKEEPLKTSTKEMEEPTLKVENAFSDAVVDPSSSTYNKEPNAFINTQDTVVKPAFATENHEPIMETIGTTSKEENHVFPTPIETLENETIKIPVQESVIENNPVKETLLEQPPMDDFGAVPVPPVFEEDSKGKKNKEGNKKVIVVLLLLLLVAMIGFGVYYFLRIAKTSAANKISLKEVKLELGQALSNNIDDYATISGYNKKDCSVTLNNLSVDKVDLNKVGTYKFTVTCGKVSEEGLIIVDDTTSPEVYTNDLTILQNASLNVMDFIAECVDASACSYEIVSNITDLTKTLGEKEVEILVSDAYNNQTTTKAKLTVATTAPTRYLTCKKNAENLSDISATQIDSYRIGIDASDNFFNAVRSTEFKFNTENDYNNVLKDYSESIGIHSIIGNTTFNEKKKSITIKSNKTLDDMNKDLNGRIPNSTNVLRAFLSGLGYTCN